MVQKLQYKTEVVRLIYFKKEKTKCMLLKRDLS